MPFEIDAVYENGTLKPDHPLPLEEHQRVKIIVQEESTIVSRTYGIIGWKDNPEAVRHFALEPDAGISESP